MTLRVKISMVIFLFYSMSSYFSKVDHVIINHGEPDHSSSLPAVMEVGGSCVDIAMHPISLRSVKEINDFDQIQPLLFHLYTISYIILSQLAHTKLIIMLMCTNNVTSPGLPPSHGPHQ